MRIPEMVCWMVEREIMRMKHDNNDKKPWSRDPVMAGTRFTNVRREDDKVTKWLKENWRDPFAKDPRMPAAMVLARMVNYIPTLEELDYPSGWPEEHILAVLKRRASEGEKVWSSAYTITTCGREMAKEDYVVQHVCRAVLPRCPAILRATTLKEAFELLGEVDGLGSFLAAQVVADLKHVPGLPLNDARDFKSWSAPGPGSLKGLSAFYGYQVTPRGYDNAIKTAWHDIKKELPREFHDLSMQDIQNCFCEFSKYVRIKEGGHARNKY